MTPWPLEPDLVLHAMEARDFARALGGAPDVEARFVPYLGGVVFLAPFTLLLGPLWGTTVGFWTAATSAIAVGTRRSRASRLEIAISLSLAGSFMCAAPFTGGMVAFIVGMPFALVAGRRLRFARRRFRRSVTASFVTLACVAHVLWAPILILIALACQRRRRDLLCLSPAVVVIAWSALPALRVATNSRPRLPGARSFAEIFPTSPHGASYLGAAFVLLLVLPALVEAVRRRRWRTLPVAGVVLVACGVALPEPCFGTFMVASRLIVVGLLLCNIERPHGQKLVGALLLVVTAAVVGTATLGEVGDRAALSGLNEAALAVPPGAVLIAQPGNEPARPYWIAQLVAVDRGAFAFNPMEELNRYEPALARPVTYPEQTLRDVTSAVESSAPRVPAGLLRVTHLIAGPGAGTPTHPLCRQPTLLHHGRWRLYACSPGSVPSR